MKLNQDSANLAQAYNQFIASFKTVVIASTSATHQAEASYAPFVEFNGNYFIFISELAQHTQNLVQTKNCSLLFIEDEDKTNNLFARKRVSLQCSAEHIEKNSTDYQALLTLFQERFGKFMQLLQTLPDFHLFCLKPQSGNYIAGFGQAYALSGSDLSQLQHRNPEAGNVRLS